MDHDCLRLTTYFGERDRAGQRLLADALLDVYGQHQIHTSVLLRGIEGFGLEHQLRSDALLTLSEDLPVVTMAVDSRARIQAMLGEVSAIQRRGLITLQRVAMLDSQTGDVELPAHAEDASRLTVHVGRSARVGRQPAFVAAVELLHRLGVGGATVLLGVDGTAHGERRRARFFARNANVPMMIVAVGSVARIAAAVGELAALLGQTPLIVEPVRVCKRDGLGMAPPHTPAPSDEDGLARWQQLTVYSSEHDRVDGHPLHRALMARLRGAEVSGASTLRGIWGFHGEHRPHGDKLLQRHRHVPVVTIVLDTPERIGPAFEIVDELTADGGLVTSEVLRVPGRAPATPVREPRTGRH
jgi:PII-like signaling protein